MREFRLASLVLFLAVSAVPAHCPAQDLSITSAGERDINADTIKTEGSVTRYFGMYTAGLGQGIIRVSAGSQSAQKPYQFQVSPSRFTSFLFDGDLAENINIKFRRGVFGNVGIEILNQAGEVQDSTILALDVTQKRSNCRKHPSPKLKKCQPIDLSKAGNGVLSAFVKKFLSSIRGPVVLEP